MHRCFPNTLPDYDPSLERDEIWSSESSDISKRMLYEESSASNTTGVQSFPSFPSPEEFLESGLALKEQVLKVTWEEENFRARDPFLYTGVLGTAFLCLRSYEATGNKKDLFTCLDIVDACARSSNHMKLVYSFICGQPGIYALGAVAAKLKKDENKFQLYKNLFLEVAEHRYLSAGPSEGGFGLPYELLYGRAGFLWAALFINHYVGAETVPSDLTAPVIEAVIEGGRAGAVNGGCPLTYRWHGTRYLGAAHGIFGIIHTLLHFPLNDEQEDVIKSTLHYLISHRLPSGNYASSEGNEKDQLVHWCHGAPAAAITLCKAFKVFPKEKLFLEAAIEAGEVVWNRGLLRRLGICHGVSGNTYVFLALYNATKGKKHLHRAKSFATFLHCHLYKLLSTSEMHGGDRPYSLFEGLAGTACMWMDMDKPNMAKFPAYEI